MKPTNKEEYRTQLAETFAHVLEEKGLTWRKEWQGIGGQGGAAHNGVTKACYRGSNAFWLGLVAMVEGYKDPRWVTMVQIMDRKGIYHPNQQWHLKKGTKATYVEYWYPYDNVNKKAVTWEQYREDLADGRSNREFTMSTRYTAVFNACQVEGMPALEAVTENQSISKDALVKKLSESLGVSIHSDGGDRAYYSPVQDTIHLPTAESFTTEYDYNSTALHELAHSTGHPLRLNRPMSAFFGTEQYAYEELVAEMASCFMGAELQMEATPQHLENHRAYVQSWIQSIKDKPETLIKAIKDAQSAASYMDYKAGLITEKEYEKARGSVMEVKEKARDLER